MKVILTQNIQGVGQAGEIKDVADGFARNQLLPAGKAIVATPAEIERIKAQETKKAHAAEQKKVASANAEKALADMTLEFVGEVSEAGHLFGSITNKDIAKRLKDDYGIKIQASKIKTDHLKEVGNHICDVSLAGQRKVKLKIVIRAK